MNNSILDNMGKRHSNIDIMKNINSIGEEDNSLRVNRSLKNIRKHIKNNRQIAPIKPLGTIGPIERSKIDRNIR